MATIQWRKWNRLIHRDLGYLCAGLTVIYAVSGLAVNHMGNWNPNYKITSATVNIGPVVADDPRDPATVEGILRRAGLRGDFRDSFRRDDATLDIFVEEGLVRVHLPSGEVDMELREARRGLREANYLHLNHAQGLWTYMADLYALALLLLAVTGLFVIKGKKGITGRGAWLTIMGIVIPLLFLWVYR